MADQPVTVRRLDDLVIEETSGVDHPANLAGGWLVVKQEGAMADTNTGATSGFVTSTTTTGTGVTVVTKAPPPPPPPGGGKKPPMGPHAFKPSKEDDQVCAACGEKMTGGMHKRFGAKKEAGMPDAISKEGLTAEQLAAVEALEASLAKAEEDKAKVEEELQKARDAKPEPPKEPDLASIQKAVEDSERLRKEAEDRYHAEVAKAADLAERVEKMERERREGEYIAKARDLANLSASPNTLGLLLLDIAEKIPAETFKQLEQLLKAANAQLERSDLFKAVGHPVGDETSLEFRIQKKAEEMVTAGKAATVQIAKAKVLETDSEIRAEYIARRAQEGR